MTFKYLLIDDYGNVSGHNDETAVLQIWDSGECLVIDLASMTTFEEGGEGESPSRSPIPDYTEERDA